MMQEERKKILNMVKEGKLSVHEALVLLEQLGNKGEAGGKDPFTNSLPPSPSFEDGKKGGNDFEQKYQSTKDKFFDFIETAVKKIKDLEIDLNFGKSVEITHIFEQSDVSLSRIDIDIMNGSAHIVPWEEKNVKIDCKVKMYRVNNEEEAKDALLRNVYFSTEGNTLRFTTEQKWMKLDATFYVPKEQYDNIKIRMFNGSIQGENLKVETFDSKVANGKIDVINLEGQYFEAETGNGKVDLKNSKMTRVDIETLNGAITIDGSYQDVDAKSFNGNIHCYLNDLTCEKVEAKTTTGGIRIQLPERAPIRGEVVTNLGNLNIDYIGLRIIEEKNDVVQKMARFEPEDPSEKATKMDLETTTGMVTIKRS